MKRGLFILGAFVSLSASAEETPELYGGFVVAPLTETCQAVGTALAPVEYTGDEIGIFCGTVFLQEWTETAISPVPYTLSTEQGSELYYNLQGERLTRPQRGINIVRMSDGTIRKVLLRSATR